MSRPSPPARFTSPRQISTSAQPHARALRLERLEDRRLLAVLSVTTLTDTVDAADGVTSLREAILAANQASGADAIDFDASLFVSGPATIFLNQGELKVTSDLAINGPGANLLTIDPSGMDPTPHSKHSDGSRIFNIDDGASTTRTVTISGVKLTGADVSEEGGAILSRERLTVSACTIVDNHATASGGAIYHDGGALVVNDSTISGNSSFSYSGGGGISSRGETTVTFSTISGNSAGDSGGGIWHRGGMLTLTDCTIAGNWTRINTPFISEGGGVWSDTGLIVTRCTITANRAGYYDNFNANGGGMGGGVFALGPLTITESTITGNVAIQGAVFFQGVYGYGGVGGGVYHRGGAATITSSNISNNNAWYQGGGVVNYAGTLVITDCTISGNCAELNGGGVYSTNGNFARSTTSLTINRSTINGNTARDIGGGVISRGNNLTINSSTISGNSGGRGGGIDSDNSTARISYSTITSNSAKFDGGGISTLGSLTLRHAIIAGNTRGAVPEENDVSGSVTASFSLFGVNAGATIINGAGTPTNLIGTIAAPIDPLLAPLADNGGPTKTHALLRGSPAIDAGDPNSNAGVGLVPPFDQRGAAFARVFDGVGADGPRIDIGAYERKPVTPSADFNDDQFIDGVDFLVWQRGFGTLAPNVAHSAGNADDDDDVDAEDLAAWIASFGAPGGAASALTTPSDATSASLRLAYLDGGASAPAALTPATIDAAISLQETIVASTTRRSFRPRSLRAL